MRFVTTPLLCTQRISLGRPIAQAIQEKVEQAAGLVALFGRAGDERDPADAEHHVGSVDIASQLSLCSARFQQRVNGPEQAFATLGEWVAPRCDHRSQSLRHPMFGGQVVDEAIHPRSQCDVGRHRLQQFRNTGAEPCQLVAVRGFDESLAGWEMPMPTPASAAIDSNVTSGPSCEKARRAISSSRSRLRWASARSGRAWAVDTVSVLLVL
jgi:hypothetical protein